MMRIGRAVMVTACVASLAGCAPAMNEEKFAAYREAVIGSPAMYQKELSQCVAKIRQNPKLVEQLAVLINAPADRTPGVVCERFTKALKDGKFTYELYAKSTMGVVTPEVIRIAQGR
jgi:hypothetical protein